ncbi:dihydroorotase [Bifidobacterium lemurum]|uniref:Dihydroorotase n=1 Tax=Bifidobacterium lemurum TaxID=1603886 RepID=A0A261FMP4_9BIFI|nr:dihydroorotase [Bifidobacterium lemurum]OZG60086.1 dihydroorotase [Bifidobacterium lemurum]QOL34062.1 amidohydrolase family protein [Bifidobacterium lemurum]
MTTIVFHGISVWDTDEIIDLKVEASPNLLVESPTTPSVILSEGRSPQSKDPIHIDATGLTLAPGFADPHVHFRDPGQTYKESMVSGCAAAASGGYTNVLIMPNTVPAMDGETITDPNAPGAKEVLDAGYDNVIDLLQHYEAAHDVALPVKYDLCVCASKGRDGHEASDPDGWGRYLPGVDDEAKDADQLAHPVTAISDDGSAVTPEIIDQVFANTRETGLYLIEHCEHHDTGAVNDGPVSRKLGVPGIPEDTELNIVRRDIDKARETGVHVHFQHVSTAISFEAIRAAKAEGLPITCETAPHYLALCDEALLEYGTLAKMNPPLRGRADRLATIAAVADGTVDLLATDHAPHTLDEKALGFLEAPNGIIGLECAYGVCHKVLVDGGHISDARLIELMSVAPARLMGHTPTDITALLDKETDASREPDAKRVLDLTQVADPGDVNLVVLDTAAEWTVEPERFHSQARNTPFGGWRVTGRPLATIVDAALAFSRL